MANQDIVPVTSSAMPQAIIPDNFDSVIEYARLVEASGMAPTGIKSKEAIAVAIMHGYELGMTPLASLQSIAVINGRPSVWGDGALAIVRASGLLDDFEESYEGEWGTDSFKAVCRVRRKGTKSDTFGEFSIEDAKTSQLWNKAGPWTQYPKRMLKMRARAFALRDAFTDILRGMAITEEVQDYTIVGEMTRLDNDPPAPKDEETKPRRGRPPKRNQYQDDEPSKPDRANAEDAETEEVENGKPSDDDAKDSTPAPEKEKAAEKEPAKKSEPENTAAADDEPPAPKSEEKKVEPKDDKDDPHAEFMKDLVSRVGPDRELKDYITALDKTLSKAATTDDLRAAWNAREKTKFVAAQEEFVKNLRDWHKKRVADAEAGNSAEDEPPAPDDDNGGGFDLPGFLHELDVTLGKEKTPDGVNSVFEKMTAEPLKLGILTEEIMENDVRPLVAEHMGRVDF